MHVEGTQGICEHAEILELQSNELLLSVRVDLQSWPAILRGSRIMN